MTNPPLVPDSPTPPALGLLRELVDRVRDELPDALDGLTPDQVLWRPDAGANSIGWLAWHLSRVQDDHVAGVAAALGRPVGQVWPEHAEAFGLPYDLASIGYGQSADQVAAFSVGDVDLLVGYAVAVHELTVRVIEAMDESDLGRQVDTFDGEPISAQVRLVSVVGDITQHLGQISYLRGLLERR